MLLAHKQNPLPSNYDKGTTIQHGISEMIAERNRLFSILEEFMLLVMVHSPRVVFICPGINYFSTKQLGVFWATQAVMQDNSQHPLLYITSENMYTYIRLRRRKSRPEIEHKWCTARKSLYVEQTSCLYSTQSSWLYVQWCMRNRGKSWMGQKGSSRKLGSTCKKQPQILRFSAKFCMKKSQSCQKRLFLGFFFVPK